MDRPHTILSTPRYVPVLGCYINPTGILMDVVNGTIKGFAMAAGALCALAIFGLPS